jgi:outer membrane scaffolding protein for murein synthesis (MipA/OmpV family)
VGRVLLLGTAVLGSGLALATEPVTLEASRDYVIGASLVSSAGHLGESEQRLSLRPLWAFQLGRFRLATSRANSLLNVGREAVDPGLSTVLVTDGGWRLSTSLQIRDKRTSGDDPLLSGLPDVRATLLGRASASIALGSRWSGSLSATHDLLDRGAGLGLGAGLGYRYPVSRRTYWDASVGLGWSNAIGRQTTYGIGPEAALASGRAPYSLGAGWDSVGLGWSVTTALSENWVAFGGVSASQLLGAAARSPLVGRTTVYSASLGLAWRGGR